MGGDAGGDRKQPDLARGVEPEPEQHAERIGLPARGDPARELADEEAVHEAAVLQPPLELRLVELAALEAEEDADDVDQDEQVEDADDPEERPGDACADVAAVVPEGRDLRVDGLGGNREPGREREHDRRVSEREEETDTDGTLLLLEQLARRVVDCGDVVGVEGVPEAERVREHAQPRQRGVRARIPGKEAPAEAVQEEHDREEAREACGLGAAHVTWGSARAVIARPSPSTTIALAAGRRRIAWPPTSTRPKMPFAATARRPSPVIAAARPKLKATIRTSP